MFKWSVMLAGPVLLQLGTSSHASSKVAVGTVAPDFHATLFDGTKISLADYKGEVVIVNIWATWCGPCKQELPLLNAYVRVQGKFGLNIVAVTTEDSVPPYLLKPLQKALSFPLARSLRGPYGPIGEAVPTNYVIGRNGAVRYAKAGAFSLDELNQVIVPLLQEPRPPA